MVADKSKYRAPIYESKCKASLQNQLYSIHQSSLPNNDVNESEMGRANTSSSTSSSSSNVRKQPDDVLPEYDFDWETYRNELDEMFFKQRGIIEKFSNVHKDFWTFFQKYISFQRKRAQNAEHLSKSHSPSEKQLCKLGLPETYDKSYRINLMVNIPEGSETRPCRGLDSNRIGQFHKIVLYYLDFVQKQAFGKLKKIQLNQQQLPIYEFKEKIISTIQQNQVVVIAGDTGCGKSTQIPQYLMQAGFCKMACTQPRRIACMSLCNRVAYETLNEHGSAVAYQVRFEKSRTATTKILFLTEGLLLRQVSSDQMLSMYDVIVMDEVHERHMHTDFLLGVLKCLLYQRADLKLVLMSATINVEMFSDYFDGAPVVKVPGRQYPIKLHYCPLSVEEQAGKASRLDPGPYMRILQAIDKRHSVEERGDVLIFLSGMAEITVIAEAVRDYAQRTGRWVVLSLHSSLPLAEQDKVFHVAPAGIRKCILSTNIAETSVTVDGVRFVIDSGKVKEMSFDNAYKMQRLREFWISQASAEQRKGRAGRTGPGVCYRLYGETDYENLQEYSTPELQRVPLASLVLQMVALGLSDVRRFPYIEPPDATSIEGALVTLREQRAITPDEKLTTIGGMLAKLPVDIVIGKMLLMACVFQLAEPVLTVAAALSVQTPFSSRTEHYNSETSLARKELESEHGDPLTLLNTFNTWAAMKTQGQTSRRWCQRRGLEQQRLFEMSKLRQQFRELLQDHNLMTGRGHSDTATERRERLIQQRQLQRWRRQKHGESRQRKMLKMEDNYDTVERMSDDVGEQEDLESNIQNMELHLSRDLTHVDDQSGDLSRHQLDLLKLILCCGLYPQVAIADEHNSYSPDSDQAFHTASKMFSIIHPTSVFARRPELLAPPENDSKKRSSKSRTHELLAYVSLLETTKPYLVGTMRVPALQTLFLFAASLDTNADCTRIICDSWIELRLDDADIARKTLLTAVKLRSDWQELLELKLRVLASRDRDDADDDSEDDAKRKAHRMSRRLSAKLLDFLHCNVTYSIRRILSAEQQHLYVGVASSSADERSADAAAAEKDESHDVKGGSKVNDYLTCGCLRDADEADVWKEYTECLQRYWTCPLCQSSMVVSAVDRLQHELQCQAKQPDSVESELPEQAATGSSASSGKCYHCPKCEQTLMLNTVEILKHRKSCQKQN